MRAILAACLAVLARAGSFEIQNGTFLKDGKPFRIMSGSLHYSRVDPSLWRDRLQRLRAMGLNAIETYVFWNFHQHDWVSATAAPAAADFTGARDLAKFCQTAQEEGLVVLLRLGPYGCGEWNGGGIPWWLHKLNASAVIRTYAEPYISAVNQWWGQLLPYVKANKLLYSDGGPVIMAQVENEYGSFGDVGQNPSDRQYLEHLIALARQDLGDSIVLYTTDGGSEAYMSRGSLNSSAVYTVGDFGPGSNPETSFAAQDAFNPPPMRGAHLCSEFYSGWLTHWGEHMANTSSSVLANAMGQLFALNGSLSLYMGHGGTNFGTWAGANGGGQSFEPHITSYDYDSPLSESGAHGYGSDGVDKYSAVQDVLLEWTRRDKSPVPPPEQPPNPLRGYGAVLLGESTPLLAHETLVALATNNTTTSLGSPPLAFHALGVADGLVWMTSPRPGPDDAVGAAVDVGDPHDRAQVFVDGLYAGASWRPQPQAVSLQAHSPAGSANEVGVLVEGMGRINYGRQMFDLKGIGPNAVPNGQAPSISFGSQQSALRGPWRHLAIPLDDSTPSKVPFGAAAASAGPGPAAFLRGSFSVSGQPADTYLGTYGWSKGYAWVNGHLLGRYWETKGPQHTLYAPAAFLRPGSNEIVLLELDAPSPNASVVLVSYPDFHYGSPCDITAAGEAGNLVVMYSELAGAQQAWSQPASGTTPGQITLASDKTLCLQAGPAKDASTGRPAIQLAACDPSGADAAQLWTMTTKGALLVSSDSSCMDITAHGTANGSAVETYACNNGDNQLWTTTAADGAGSVKIGTRMDQQLLTVCGKPK